MLHIPLLTLYCFPGNMSFIQQLTQQILILSNSRMPLSAVKVTRTMVSILILLKVFYPTPCISHNKLEL